MNATNVMNVTESDTTSFAFKGGGGQIWQFWRILLISLLNLGCEHTPSPTGELRSQAQPPYNLDLGLDLVQACAGQFAVQTQLVYR